MPSFIPDPTSPKLVKRAKFEDSGGKHTMGNFNIMFKNQKSRITAGAAKLISHLCGKGPLWDINPFMPVVSPVLHAADNDKNPEKLTFENNIEQNNKLQTGKHNLQKFSGCPN